MRHLLTLLIAAFLLVPQPGHAWEQPKPQLIAVYFYADWCPNCKALTPTIAAVRSEEKLDEKPILFVTMDLTDKPRIHQSILLAQALGIGDFLKAQGSATGYVAVLDANSKKELARFDRTATKETIAKFFSTQLSSGN